MCNGGYVSGIGNQQNDFGRGISRKLNFRDKLKGNCASICVPQIGFDGRRAVAVDVGGCSAKLAAVGPVLVLGQQLFLLQGEEAVLQRVVCDEGEVHQACACAPLIYSFLLQLLLIANRTILPNESKTII
jgi:hypothetical protein